jgi:drug/metabolite transporter (DMT)-like permease
MLGVLAVMLWSVVLAVVDSLTAQGVPAHVVQFHLVFWGAAGALVVLLLWGRTDELSVFKRQETVFLLLVLTGGYGFWILQGVAFERVGTRQAHLFFYLAPLLMAALSFLGREQASGRQIGALLLGFAGCVMILAGGSSGGQAVGAPSAGGYVLAVGHAACWAAFSLLARPVVREEKTLPVVALVLGGGALCLLVTNLSAGRNVLAITTGQLVVCAATGILALAGAFGLWLACVSHVPVASVSSLWYLGALFGAGLAYRFKGDAPGWLTLVGGIFILLALRSGLRRRRGGGKTMGDIIRGD